MTTVLDPVPTHEAPAPPDPPPITRAPGGNDTRLRRVWRGPESDPRWARPGLFALLATTAVLYLWNLGANGWANTFYSGAVQAGTQSWKAFFFGSSDASNFITVDKTPLSLWPMEISARIFGLSSWSILVPQALEGVLAVGILYAAVKRWFGAGPGLLAGAIFALTPVAALMFRFNNPDAALTLLMVAGAYAMTRAMERDSTRWIVLAGVAVGLAFLAKELQAFLVLPGFGLAYLIAGPPAFGRRVGHVILLGLTTIVAGGWWVAIVSVWPTSSRPYIGGSQNNSFFNVLFGYNGFGRLTGDETGSVGAGPAGTAGRWGATGLTRLFNRSYGGQASWLIPAALILLVVGLVWTATWPRTERTRAALVLWGGWLVMTGLAISLGKGIIHEYYTVALAPAIGAVIAVGGALMWRYRAHWAARAVLAVTTVVTAVWASTLLHRTPDWFPALRVLVLVGGLVVAALLLVPFRQSRVTLAVVGAAIVVGLAAPTAYTLSTVRSPKAGAIPTAGPAGQSRGFGPGGGAFGGPGGGGSPGGANGNFPARGANGTFPVPGGTNGAFPGVGGRAGGALGGLLNGSTVGAELTQLLERGSDGYRWVAAAVGANNAASYQLASGQPIMAIGGFNGSDPTPTLAEFQRYVADGKVHYFIGGGGGPGGGFGGGFGGGLGGASGTSSQISTWVTENFAARTVNGVTIYDLTQPTSDASSGSGVS